MPVWGLIGLVGASAPAADVLLTWQDNSSNELGFRLERSSSDEAWREIAVVGANATSYTDSSPVPDVQYSYRVRAYDSARLSDFSNIASVRLSLPAAANTAPTISALADVEILAGATTGALTFVVADNETAANDLMVTVRSSNSVVVPAASLALSGSGGSRVLVVSPPLLAVGTARITVTVSDGELTASASFVLAARAATAPPVITRAPRSTTVSAGEALLLDVAATGAGPVELQWYHDGAPISGATDAELVIPSAQRFHAGEYYVQATSGGLSVASPPVRVTVNASASAGSRLLNLSARAWCGTGDAVLIPGFILRGTGTAQVLVRAVGPTLSRAPFNVSGALSNPRAILKHWNGISYGDVAQNLDWSSAPDMAAIRSATDAVGAFAPPAPSRDAALLPTLEPGQYSVIVDDEAQRAGVSLVEIYDGSGGQGGVTLSNLSNRGLVGAGDRTMILGFVVAPDGPMTLLLRAVGPGLAGTGLDPSTVLPDPVLELYGSDGAGGSRFLFANDNWTENPDQAFTAAVADQVAAFALPRGSADAAIVATLLPGAYTAIVHGVPGSNEEGVALVEIYTVP